MLPLSAPGLDYCPASRDAQIAQEIKDLQRDIPQTPSGTSHQVTVIVINEKILSI
jgi:hypothetical protein